MHSSTALCGQQLQREAMGLTSGAEETTLREHLSKGSPRFSTARAQLQGDLSWGTSCWHRVRARDTRRALVLGAQFWQLLISSQSRGDRTVSPVRCLQCPGSVHQEGSLGSLQVSVCLSVCSQPCAVQGGLPQAGALLWRALNEIVGAAGKRPQDLSETEFTLWVVKLSP